MDKEKVAAELVNLAKSLTAGKFTLNWSLKSVSAEEIIVESDLSDDSFYMSLIRDDRRRVAEIEIKRELFDLSDELNEILSEFGLEANTGLDVFIEEDSEKAVATWKLEKKPVRTVSLSRALRKIFR